MFVGGEPGSRVCFSLDVNRGRDGDSRQGPGLFPWPARWRFSWRAQEHTGRVEVELASFNTLASWVVGGAAAAIATGEVSTSGKPRAPHGLAQVIR